MASTKIHFQNADKQQLTGVLDLPADGNAVQFAIFAHCFTCTKNLSAIRNISRSLTSRGFGVLRFDFTGLGESEGVFSDTRFSGNVEDLLAASAYLSQHHQPPSLLIGHSLGGAAVIVAASRLNSVKAIATIGAPADPAHVKHLIKDAVETIESRGKATVNIGGRDFTIKKQFLTDLETHDLGSLLKDMKKPILILHSPQDSIVEIENAKKLYIQAFHPKSFISLDGADHLLSNKEDSLYTGEVIAAWAGRYLQLNIKKPELLSPHRVVAHLEDTEGYTTQMRLGNHYSLADEPESAGGADLGPTPYDYLAGALSSCTVMTLMMYARRKKWNLEKVEVHTDHSREHQKDSDQADSQPGQIDVFERRIRMFGDLDGTQRARLLEIADRCPVHRTLEGDIAIRTREFHP